ncbi:hypothetical protein JZ751_023129 [Albula glossodonta]|uniref:RYR1 n=1 Tax=Albula glossodonta TaxID=121402 RepID=A0A8T2PN17_9TELE|nr:hypothetical protein JZ751_023129 [Albula glossodonta]
MSIGEVSHREGRQRAVMDAYGSRTGEQKETTGVMERVWEGWVGFCLTKVPRVSTAGGSDVERTKKKRRGDRYSVQTSLIVAALKKMLPIGLNMCSPADQELINLAKIRYSLKDTDEEVREFLQNNLHLQGKVSVIESEQTCMNLPFSLPLYSLLTPLSVENPSMRWQMALYKEMSGKAEDADDPAKVVKRVQEVSAVLYHIEVKAMQEEEEEEEEKETKPDPLHQLILHFSRTALTEKSCHIGEEDEGGEEEVEGGKEEMSFEVRQTEMVWGGRGLGTGESLELFHISHCTPAQTPNLSLRIFLSPLFSALLFSFLSTASVLRLPIDLVLLGLIALVRDGTKTRWAQSQRKPLNQLPMPQIVSLALRGMWSERGGKGGEWSTEKEMEKQRLLYQQSRLHNRGAAEMVLQMISACKGVTGCMVSSTLKLGISILNGGNSEVQQKMLDYLKDKKDVGFFLSLQALMQSCSVLDLNAFERQNKAEGLGMVSEEGTSECHNPHGPAQALGR